MSINEGFLPIVLFEGYSKVAGDKMKANCTSVLIKGPPNIIIDTLTAWDSAKLTLALEKHSVTCDKVDYVICTHGHSDHIGCNHLFTNAVHIVGFSISKKDEYFLRPDFSNGEEFIINDKIKVIPTPGHTMQDVSVLINSSEGVFAVTGDLFEKKEDLDDETIWIEAGSDSQELQRQNREKILKIARFIVPGHGPMFEVPRHWK